MLTLDQANRLIEGAIAEASSCGAKPLGVIVLDAGGHLIAFQRQDGASLFRFDIARAKAMGALGMGADTRDIAQRAASNPTFFASVAVATGGNLALSPGGVLIRNDQGSAIGAVGISGDTGDCDEQCAFAGIVAAGLRHGASS